MIDIQIFILFIFMYSRINDIMIFPWFQTADLDRLLDDGCLNQQMNHPAASVGPSVGWQSFERYRL